MKKRELPVLSHLQVNDMNFRRIDSIVFIAMLAPDDTHHLSIFTSAAQTHHFQFAFGHTTDPSIPAEEKVQTPSILCYRNDDGDSLLLSGPFTQRDVDKFLVASSTSVMKTFHEKNVEQYMQRDKLTAYIFLRNPDESQVGRDLGLVAKKYDGVVIFAAVDLSRYAEMPGNFGIHVRGDEALVVHAPGNDQIFYFKQGKKIGGKEVEDMLVTILQGKASEGQIFGEGAEDVHEREGDEGAHDEL
ncbi:thioredoxin-like domain-containing protein [Ampelomyces quisqualis]|uniref:Thioredoxin-like domain-containing protein n=1 Tax=Ampelomyces quisqualis TaxID=50730 RepID=A0A6A5R2H2_AMPQU|nr:thioredoxin-like domain-containing protein [Ampelomyces quisqualis]